MSRKIEQIKRDWAKTWEPKEIKVKRTDRGFGATMMRNDAHRPSTINPEDYEYVAQECMRIEGIGDASFLMAERELLRAHMARTGGTYSGHQHGGNCMVCGSVNAVYTVLFYHGKTNSYVRMGTDCAAKCDMGDPNLFDAFRKGVKDARELQKGKNKAKALLSDRGLDRAWDMYDHISFQDIPESGQEESTIENIVGKLVKYGSISDKQFDYLGTLLTRIDTRAEREAKRKAEDEAAKPCPTGRIEVTGTVLTTKYQESVYGETLKMLVKADDGWKVWGTVPSILEIFTDGDIQRGLQHGDRVRFKAQVTPSDTDTKFGFFKRPTQAEVIS